MGALRHAARVHVLAEIAVGPAVEAAFLYRSQVIGDQVCADLVALVYNGPELACSRFPLQPRWVAYAGGDDPAGTGLRVDFQNVRAAVFDVQAVLGDVAVRADTDIHLLDVRTCQQRLGPRSEERRVGKESVRRSR